MRNDAATTIDKSGWGDGPWQTEPDRLEWEHAGLPCLMVRHPRHGHWCGYAAVPPGHPYHGKPYRVPDARVHGGLTYSARCADQICHVPATGLGNDRNYDPFVALGMAVCALDDDWSTREGRKLAFGRAVRECGLLGDDRNALLAEFLRRFPNPPQAQPRERKLTGPEKDARWSDGEAIRAGRWRPRREEPPRSRAQHDALRLALREQERGRHA